MRQPADSNCLFSAMSHGLRESSTGRSLRAEVAGFIAANPMLEVVPGETLGQWVTRETGLNVNAYADEIAMGDWGGDIEMAVAAILARCNVEVYELEGAGKDQIEKNLRAAAAAHPARYPGDSGSGSAYFEPP